MQAFLSLSDLGFRNKWPLSLIKEKALHPEGWGTGLPWNSPSGRPSRLHPRLSPASGPPASGGPGVWAPRETVPACWLSRWHRSRQASGSHSSVPRSRGLGGTQPQTPSQGTSLQPTCGLSTLGGPGSGQHGHHARRPDVGVSLVRPHDHRPPGGLAGLGLQEPCGHHQTGQHAGPECAGGDRQCWDILPVPVTGWW